MQLGSADGRDQRVGGRPAVDREREVVFRAVRRVVRRGVGRPTVARRGEHGDPVNDRVDVGAAQRQDRELAREGLLGRPEALADHVAEAMVDHVVLSLDDLGKPLHAGGLVDRRFHQQNVCPGSHRVGVLDVQRRLNAPSALFKVGRVIRRDRPGRLDDLERRRRRQVGLLIKRHQVALDRRRAVGVDQDDGLARAREALAVQRIQIVGLVQLRRLIARDARIGFALSRRWRLCKPMREE